MNKTDVLIEAIKDSGLVSCLNDVIAIREASYDNNGSDKARDEVGRMMPMYETFYRKTKAEALAEACDSYKLDVEFVSAFVHMTDELNMIIG